MKARRALVVLPVALVALFFASGCPWPTVDLNGTYRFDFSSASTFIRVVTTFPATTCTGSLTGWDHFGNDFSADFTGTISATNEIAFTVVASPTNPWPGSWKCTGVDSSGDGVADRLDCTVVADQTMNPPIPFTRQS